MFASVVDYKRSFVVHYQRSFVFVVVCRVDGGDDDDDDDDDDGGGGGVSNGSFFETSISIRFPLRVSFYANDTLSLARKLAGRQASLERTRRFCFNVALKRAKLGLTIFASRERERERASKGRIYTLIRSSLALIFLLDFADADGFHFFDSAFVGDVVLHLSRIKVCFQSPFSPWQCDSRE